MGGLGEGSFSEMVQADGKLKWFEGQKGSENELKPCCSGDYQQGR